MTDKEFIDLREEFSKELEPRVHQLELACWEFYTNSTPQNMENYENAQEEVYKLYRNKDIYNNCLILIW